MWAGMTKVVVANFHQAISDRIQQHSNHAVDSQFGLNISFMCFDCVMADIKFHGHFAGGGIVHKHDKDFLFALSEETQGFMCSIANLFRNQFLCNF